MLFYHGISGLLPSAAAYRAVGTLGTLLAVVEAKDRRPAVFIQNQSAGDLVVVLYGPDGSIVGQPILTGVGANQQGADWCSAIGESVFVGRVEVYGANGAALTVTGG